MSDNMHLKGIDFSPLYPDEPNCLLGYRSNAASADLYEAAMIRQKAALGVLEAVSGAPIHELRNESLQWFINALWVLTSDSAALHARAIELLPKQNHNA